MTLAEYCRDSTGLSLHAAKTVLPFVDRADLAPVAVIADLRQAHQDF